MRCEFRGDRFTRPALQRRTCRLVADEAGRPVSGTNGNRLVEWDEGGREVVPVRALRPLTERAADAVRAGLRGVRPQAPPARAPAVAA